MATSDTSSVSSLLDQMRSRQERLRATLDSKIVHTKEPPAPPDQPTSFNARLNRIKQIRDEIEAMTKHNMSTTSTTVAAIVGDNSVGSSNDSSQSSDVTTTRTRSFKLNVLGKEIPTPKLNILVKTGTIVSHNKVLVAEGRSSGSSKSSSSTARSKSGGKRPSSARTFVEVERHHAPRV